MSKEPLQETTRTNLTTLMRLHLPELIAAVRAQWAGYQSSPSQDKVNAMRGDVQLLTYWLARRVALASYVSFAEQGQRRAALMREIPGMQVTDLQHALYANLVARKSVTELVSGATSDFVGFLCRILANDKVSLYRRLRLDGEIIDRGHGRPNDDESSDLQDDVEWPDELSAQICAEALQCLEHFDRFIASQQLNPKLGQVAWTLWLSAPLSDKGDNADSKGNQDAALAESLGMPKKTFDRYKAQARGLVTRFREQTGW